MPDCLLDLDDIHVVDNHCHAGLFEMVLGLQEGLSLNDMRQISPLSALQSTFPPHEYRAIQEVLESQDQKRIEALDSQLGFRRVLSDFDLFISRTNLYEILQEQAFQEVYGPAGSTEELERRVQAERNTGLVQTYVNMMDRSRVAMALNNTYIFDQSQWPMERFRWIPHLDTFVFPLWGERYLTRGGSTEDYGHYVFRHPDREMVQHLRKSGLKEIPRRFSDYLTWVHEIVVGLKNEGVAALKLLMAYFRTLETDEVDASDAGPCFEKAIQGDLSGVKGFEDFMVRDLIRYCGTLDLPVQIHVGQGGPGPGLLLGDSRPMLLQNIFEHPELRKTKIVLLHGGSPFTQECGSLVSQYRNTYLDISTLTIIKSYSLEDHLIYWLETIPASKILFGTDAWTPELFWVGARNGRKTLARCLERMVRAGFYRETEAMEIAHAILYQNACRVYGLSIV
jgi:hypothetical protein